VSAPRHILAAAVSFAALVGPATAQECRQIEPRLAFCGDPTVWTERQSANPGHALALRRGVAFRANFIFGDAGTDYGDSAEGIHEFQREVYAEFTGVPLEDLVIQVNEPVMVDGYDGLRRAFPIEIDGIPFVVALTVVMRPEQNLQILTIDQGARFNDRHRRLNHEVLDLVRLNFGDKG
jgi:hypothetical protein